MPDSILVVDDEPNYRLIIGQVLASEGFDVVEAGSGAEALDLFKARPELALVLTDITMPEGDGIELLTWVKEERPEVPVVMLTAHHDVRLAVEAMRRGAFDYLTKPYTNSDLIRCVKKALAVYDLERQNRELRRELALSRGFGSLIGKSQPMVELYRLLEKVAPTRANVLITGESGTGKELVARAIHQGSPRAGQSFVAVNCSALSETLLVSELFGHEKGAFTGAASSRAGRFELAHQGTLFLDEIGEMGMSAQVTLLRVLQERSLERVGGGGKLIEVDARLITATNRDLKAEVAAGRFREDLFFRLNVVHLRLPPLRERLDDLPELAGHFIGKYAGGGRARPALSPETMRLLFAYRWPGNVRELENVIERAMVMASGDVITPGDLPEELRRPESAAHRARLYAPPEAAAGTGAGQAAGEGAGPLWTAGPAAPEEDPALLEPGSGNPQGPIDWADPLFGEIGPGWLQATLELLPKGTGLNEALSGFEEAILRLALKAGGGVQSRAADSLGLKRNVFKYKWDKWSGLPASELAVLLAEAAPAASDLGAVLGALEEEMIRRALAAAKGVQSKAADLLGLKRSVMPYKLKKYPALAATFEEGHRPG
jgi:two-component system NtrC family response regulator